MGRTRRLLTFVCCLAAPLVVACIPDDGSSPPDTTTTTVPAEPSPECKLEFRIIRTALEAYRSDVGVTGYPSDPSVLVPNYLDSPIDPTRFVYELVGTRYTLVGVGECTGLSRL